MLRYLLIWTADRLAAISEWLYRRLDDSRPEGALSLDEIEELQALRRQQFGALLQEGLDDLEQGRFVELDHAELDTLLAEVKARARRTETGP